jgi:phosphatidylserine/phosphatidylglycerophosphate/cardiolipin synthase-like enzyme
MSNAETYLDSSLTTIYSGNTEVVPLVHGENYFKAIDEWIEKTRSRPEGEEPDAVYIVGFQLDPDLNLNTGEKKSPGQLGPHLILKAMAGVDVRVIYNGSPYFSHIKGVPFRDNLEDAERLRRFIPQGATSPPLAGRVLWDWCGAQVTGSNHQKATVIKVGTELVAFVGGMDMVKDHWDSIAHSTKKWIDDTPWGWHDIGVRLRGEAAKGAWDNFRLRWTEARTLSSRQYNFFPGDEQRSEWHQFNPQPIVPPPATRPTHSPPVTSKQSVQILRSRFSMKEGPDHPWQNPPPGGLVETFRALKRAIEKAKRYIYIEDQFLKDELSFPQLIPQEYSIFQYLIAALKATPTLKLIFFGSGKSDPLDISRGLRNQELTDAIKGVVAAVRPPHHPVDLSRNVVSWRFENVTVHAKLFIVDDVFTAIGSANLMSRSMYGVDSELHTAIVDDDEPTTVSVVRKLRMDLWAEYFRINVEQAEQRAALENLDTAFGLWRPGWYAPDPTLWQTTGNPAGYDPQSRRVAFVGPGGGG